MFNAHFTIFLAVLALLALKELAYSMQQDLNSFWKSGPFENNCMFSDFYLLGVFGCQLHSVMNIKYIYSAVFCSLCLRDSIKITQYQHFLRGWAMDMLNFLLYLQWKLYSCM